MSGLIRENFVYSVNTDGSTLEIVKSYTPSRKLEYFQRKQPAYRDLIVGEAYAEHVALL